MDILSGPAYVYSSFDDDGRGGLDTDGPAGDIAVFTYGVPEATITKYPTVSPNGAPTVELQADIPNFNCTYPNWGVNCNMTATTCSDGTCVPP